MKVAQDSYTYDTKKRGRHLLFKLDATATILTGFASATGGQITLDREECRSMLRIPVDKCNRDTEAEKFGGQLKKRDKIWTIKLLVEED